MNVSKPTLIVFPKIAKSNITNMANKAKNSNVTFRPHFKTHQSSDIAMWFKELGVNKITVSSVNMAKYFANKGWNDITIAFPLNINEINEIKKLSEKIKINLLVASLQSAKNLAAANINANVYIEIDAGYTRSGINCININEIEQSYNVLKTNQKLNVIGFLSHFGNSYLATNKQDIKKVWSKSISKLLKLKSLFPNFIISIGDTPCCSVINDFSEIDEIRPGNFVFYDYMQTTIKAANYKSVALYVACPVVANYSSQNRAVIYGGAIHLSKDYISVNNNFCYGIVAVLKNNIVKILPEAYIYSLSQEHGLIHYKNGDSHYFKEGNTLLIMPIHSCLTAQCHKHYYTIYGEKLEHMSNHY